MADEQIVTSIVAKADLSNLVSEVHRVTASLQTLQRELLASNRSIAAATKVANNAFRDTLVQSGLFSNHFVNLHSDVDKFGKNLDAGRLKLKDYFSTFQQHTKTTKGLIRELAKEQVMLQNAVLQPLGRNAQGLMQFNVAVPRGLDVVKNKTQLARMEMQIMNRALSEGATSLINWGKNTQWAGRQLTVGLTVPLTMFGTQAAKAFREADQELTRLTKVYGGLAATSSADLAAIRKDVAATAKELSATMGVSFKETIALAADIAATGKQGDDLLGSLKETTRLAVLGEVDRQDAMKATLAIQSAFKQNTEELADSINFLNAVENQTSTTLNDLVEAIPKAGPVIKGLGGSVQDLALYLTAMREGGINASEGANALKSGLASLINPTKVATAQFRDFGIDLLGIVNSNAGNVTQTLLDLQSALDKLNPLQKQQAIEQLFGKFQFARMNALFENLGKQGSQTLQVLDLMKASSQDLANIAGRELSMVTESASGKFKRAMESFKASLSGVGEQFLNFGTKILNVLEKIMNFFNNLPGPIKKFLTLFGGLTAIAGPLIMITGVLANFFGYITKGIVLMRQFFMGQKGWKMLTPEMIAAQKAADMVEKSFYSDAAAAEVLHASLIKLVNDYRDLNVAMLKGVSPTNPSPSVSTVGGSPIIIPGTPAAEIQLRREVDANNPFAGERNTRAISHINPRDRENPATWLGGVPGAIPVNQKIGANPQVYMLDRLPDIEGLTSYGGVSSGIVAGEAARYHALLATLGMQTETEIAALKKTISLGGTISQDLLSTFDDILPITMRLSENAAKDAALIVAELRQGNLTVDQARARIMALNAALERDMQIQLGQFAGSRGRTIDFTKAPLMQQPAVDANAQFTLRDLYKKENNRAVMEEFGRLRGVRTHGAPYSIHVTRLPRFNVGGPVKSSKSAYGNPAPVETFGPNKTVVSGPTSINYDDRLGSIPINGYVLNQSASMDPMNSPITDPGVVASTYSGGGSGNITAGLTPGEIVYGPGITKDPELYAAVHAANNGYNFGGQILSRVKNYGKEINDAQLRDLYSKIFMVEDRVLSSPNWQEEVRLRHIMHDAAILSSHAGLSEDQAIKKATDYFDTAWKKSYSPATGLIDPKSWMRHRIGLGARIHAELEQLAKSKVINPDTGKPYKGLFTHKGVGQTKDFRPTSSLIVKMMDLAKKEGNGKVFERALGLLYPNGQFVDDTFKSFNPSDKKKTLLLIEQLEQQMGSKFLPVSEHSIRESLWKTELLMGDDEYSKEYSKLAKTFSKKGTVGFAGNLGMAMMGEDAINAATAAIHKATGGARPDMIKFTNAANLSDIKQQVKRGVSFNSIKMDSRTKMWLIRALTRNLDARSFFMPNATKMAYKNQGGPILGFNGGGSPLSIGMPKPFSKFAAFAPIAEKISSRVSSSRLRHIQPINYGHRVAETGGHSFPIPGVGGVYRRPDGELVVIKPFTTDDSAYAALRQREIYSRAHRLRSPRSTVRVMIDPTDPLGKRKFVVLESKYDPKFAAPNARFTKKQMVRQNVAHWLAGDSDVGFGNLWGNYAPDEGTAGIYTRASGFRERGAKIRSMYEQARINLLAYKGGAKKWYAQTTAPIAAKMSPSEYHQAHIEEIQAVLPRLKKLVNTFKLTPFEKKLYERQIQRLEQGLKENWRPLQKVHAAAGQNYRAGGPVRRFRKAYGEVWQGNPGSWRPGYSKTSSGPSYIIPTPQAPDINVNEVESRQSKMQTTMMRKMNLGFGMQMAGSMIGGNLGNGMLLGGLALQLSDIFSSKGIKNSLKTLGNLSALMAKFRGAISRVLPMLRAFALGLRSAFTLTNPIGWIVLAVTALGTYLSKLKKVREEQGKANRLEFGVTATSAASVGIKNYKSLTDKIKETNEQLELNKAKVQSTFDSYTKVGITGITLTVTQLKDAIKNAKENQKEYVDAINTLQASEVITYVTNLKAQFVALGLSSSEAANNIYAILKASKYADQALNAVSSSGFRAIIDQSSALAQLVKNLSSNTGYTFNAEEFSRGIDSLVNGALNYMNFLRNSKDYSAEINDEFDALKKTLEEVAKVQGSSNMLTKEQTDALKKENILYANILGTVETTQSILAKMVLYQSGMAQLVDLSSMLPDQAIAFANNLKIVNDKVDAIFENKNNSSNPLKGLATALDNAKNAASEAKKVMEKADEFNKDAIEDQIERQRDLIDQIEKERDARLKVLEVQEKSANFETDIKSAQIKYQMAMAAGDTQQAALAQLDIQRLSDSRQRDLAKTAINDEADRKREAAESEIDRLQKIIDDQSRKLAAAQKDKAKFEESQANAQSMMNGITDIVRNHIQPDGTSTPLTEIEKQSIANLIRDMVNSKDELISKQGKDLQNKYVVPGDSTTGFKDTVKSQQLINDLSGYLKQQGGSDGVFNTAVNNFAKAVEKFSGWPGGPSQGFKVDKDADNAKSWWNPTSWFSDSGSRDVGWMLFEDKNGKKWAVPSNSGNYEKTYLEAQNRGWAYRGLTKENTRFGTMTSAPAGYNKIDILPKPLKAAQGGKIKYFEPGGPVSGPGTATSDSIPAMLSDGEYVIRTAAAQEIGYDNLDRLNALGRANGGPVFKNGSLYAAQGTAVIFPSGKPSYKWTLKEKQDYLVSFLMNKGVTNQAAIGVVANLMFESGGGLTAHKFGDYDPDGRYGQKGSFTSYGIAQWHNTSRGKGRWQNLINFAKRNKLNPATLETQAQFLWYELQQRQYADLLTLLRHSSTDSLKATKLWMSIFERPKDQSEEMAKRRLNMMKGYSFPSLQETAKAPTSTVTNKERLNDPVIVNPFVTKDATSNLVMNMQRIPGISRLSALRLAQGGTVRKYAKGSKGGVKEGYDPVVDYFRMLGDLSVNFETDKDFLAADQIEELKSIAQRIKSVPGLKTLMVNGYADKRGSNAYNKALSMRRAKYVAQALSYLAPGINFIPNAKGEIGSSSSQSAMSKKRRVSINLPIGGAGGLYIQKDEPMFGGSGASGGFGGGAAGKFGGDGWSFLAKGGPVGHFDKGGKASWWDRALGTIIRPFENYARGMFGFGAAHSVAPKNRGTVLKTVNSLPRLTDKQAARVTKDTGYFLASELSGIAPASRILTGTSHKIFGSKAAGTGLDLIGTIPLIGGLTKAGMISRTMTPSAQAAKRIAENRAAFLKLRKEGKVGTPEFEQSRLELALREALYFSDKNKFTPVMDLRFASYKKLLQENKALQNFEEPFETPIGNGQFSFRFTKEDLPDEPTKEISDYFKAINEGKDPGEFISIKGHEIEIIHNVDGRKVVAGSITFDPISGHIHYRSVNPKYASYESPSNPLERISPYGINFSEAMYNRAAQVARLRHSGSFSDKGRASAPRIGGFMKYDPVYDYAGSLEKYIKVLAKKKVVIKSEDLPPAGTSYQHLFSLLNRRNSSSVVDLRRRLPDPPSEITIPDVPLRQRYIDAGLASDGFPRSVAASPYREPQLPFYPLGDGPYQQFQEAITRRPEILAWANDPKRTADSFPYIRNPEDVINPNEVYGSGLSLMGSGDNWYEGVVHAELQRLRNLDKPDDWGTRRPSGWANGGRIQKFDKGGKPKPFEWTSYKGKNRLLKDLDTSFLGGFRGAWNFLGQPIASSLSRMTFGQPKNYKWNDALYDSVMVGSLGLSEKLRAVARVGSPLAQAAFEKATARQGVQLVDRRFGKRISDLMEMGIIPSSRKKKIRDGLLTEYHNFAKGTLDLPEFVKGGMQNVVNMWSPRQLAWVGERANRGWRGDSLLQSIVKSTKAFIKKDETAFWNPSFMGGTANISTEDAARTLIHELGHRNLDLGLGGVKGIMPDLAKAGIYNPIHEAYASAFELYAHNAGKIIPQAKYLKLIKNPFEGGAFYSHAGADTDLAGRFWQHLFGTAPGVGRRTWQHGTEWLMPYASTIKKFAGPQADESVKNIEELANLSHSLLKSTVSNRMFSSTFSPFSQKYLRDLTKKRIFFKKKPKWLVDSLLKQANQADNSFQIFRQLLNDPDMKKAILNMSPEEVIKLVSNTSLVSKFNTGGIVSKFAQGGHAIKAQSMDARYNAGGVAKQTGMMKYATGGPVYNIGNMPFNFPQTPQNGRQLYNEFKAIMNIERQSAGPSIAI